MHCVLSIVRPTLYIADYKTQIVYYILCIVNYTLCILYHLLYLYQQEGCLSKKNEILIIIKEYIKLYKIPCEGVSKFMKYFSGIYDLHYSKKQIQLFY